jgi:hypothetical protein
MVFMQTVKKNLDWLGIVGIDQAVLYSASAKIWGLLTGPVTLVLIATMLSPTEQGFYYTFWSLIAAQVFFELGLGNVALFFAGHEKAKLEWDSEGKLSGDAVALSRLASLIRKTSWFYLWICCAIFTVLLPVGLFFLGQGEVEEKVSWQFPWFFMVIGTVVLLFANMLLYVLEGCGQVRQVTRVRLISGIVMSIAMWTTLLLGGKLYAAPVGNFSASVFILWWICICRRKFLKQMFFQVPILHSIRWMKEVWPMQWRSAASFINGYLMFQLFNPILFYFDSPAAAGKMGISMNLAVTAMSVSLAWINTKAATLCEWASLRKWKEMDLLFFRSMRQSLSVLLLALGLIYVGVFLLAHYFPHLATRFLDLPSMGWLIVGVIGNQILFSYPVYLRAHKQDPYVLLTLLGAVLMPLCGIWAVQRWGVLGIAQTYAVVTWVVGVGIGTWIFLRKRAEWHR